MKIGRLENLCRALQEERNELYKKIREAKMPEKDDQGQHTSDEEPNTSVNEEADPVEANSVHKAVQNLAAAFMIMHCPESTLDVSKEIHSEVNSPPGGCDTALRGLEQAPLSATCHLEIPLPPPDPQAEDKGVSETEPTLRGETGAEAQGDGLPGAASADPQNRKPEAAASSQAQEPTAEASLPAMEANGQPRKPEAATSGQALAPPAETLCVMEAECSAPPPAAGAQLPARESGCEPMRKPPPAAEGLPGGASGEPPQPKVADTNLEGADYASSAFGGCSSWLSIVVVTDYLLKEALRAREV